MQLNTFIAPLNHLHWSSACDIHALILKQAIYKSSYPKTGTFNAVWYRLVTICMPQPIEERSHRFNRSENQASRDVHSGFWLEQYVKYVLSSVVDHKLLTSEDDITGPAFQRRLHSIEKKRKLVNNIDIEQ